MRKSDLTIGILLTAIALMMIVAPDQCIKVVVVLLGVEAVVNGGYGLIKLRSLLVDNTFQMVILIRSAVSIVIGLLAIILPIALAQAVWTGLLYMLAFYLVVSAGLELYAVAKMRDTDIERKNYIVEVVVSLALAAVLFIMPREIGRVLVRLLGVFLLVVAIAYLGYQSKTQHIVVDDVEIIDDATE